MLVCLQLYPHDSFEYLNGEKFLSDSYYMILLDNEIYTMTIRCGHDRTKFQP